MDSATLAWCACPWALHVKAKIAGLAGRTLPLIVERGAVLPKIVLIGDPIFDQVVRPRVTSLPFSLNCPCAVVSKLKAWVTLRRSEIDRPLRLWNGLIHHVVKFALKGLLLPLVTDRRHCNENCIGWGDVGSDPIFEPIEPRVLVESCFTNGNRWFCLGFLADYCLHSKGMRKHSLVNAIPYSLTVSGGVKAVVYWYSIPDHLPPEINQGLTYG